MQAPIRKTRRRRRAYACLCIAYMANACFRSEYAGLSEFHPQQTQFVRLPRLGFRVGPSDFRADLQSKPADVLKRCFRREDNGFRAKCNYVKRKTETVTCIDFAYARVRDSAARARSYRVSLAVLGTESAPPLAVSRPLRHARRKHQQ